MVSKLLLSVFLVTAAPSLSEVNPVTVTDTGFALTWTTAWPVAGAVSYGTDPRSLAMTASATGPLHRFHYLFVSGLAPAARPGLHLEKSRGQLLVVHPALQHQRHQPRPGRPVRDQRRPDLVVHPG